MLYVSKRFIDLLFAVLGLISMFPVLITVALAIRLTMGEPIFFRQVRAGYRGKPFVIWKFRTMNDSLDSDGKPLPDADRLTKLGRLLRRLSLDELPQLWNVVRGDLSLVGPRPLLLDYLPLYNTEQSRRHDVKPGITGWAQVHGRNATDWQRRLAYDVWYVDNWSLHLDLKILSMTFSKVFTGEGVSGDGEITMSRFQGSKGKAL